MLKTAFALLLAAGSLNAQRSSTGALTLRTLFDSLSAHPTVRASDSRIRAAEGSRTTSRALGNPMIMWQDEKPRGGAAHSVDRETMFTATLPLEPLFQRWSRVREADAAVRGAAAERFSTRQEIALRAAAAYYRVALAQVGVATAQDLVAWLDSLVGYNRARVKEGVAAEVDLLRSRIERDLSAADFAMQRAELERARASLAAFLGDRTIGELPVVNIAAMPLAIPATTSASPPTPERASVVRIAQSRVDAANAALTTERTMVLRQLGFTLGTKEMAGTTSAVVGLSLPVPIFDVNRGQIIRAGAERAATAFELASARREATAELRGLEAAAVLLTAYSEELAGTGGETFLARAEETRRIALGAYREGAVPLMQVLDAARAWGEARMAYHRALFMQHETVLQLTVARGDDLMSNIPAPATASPSNR